MLVTVGLGELRARGNMALALPGWSRYSIWGWHDREQCMVALLWQDTDNADDDPRVSITPVTGWPATGLPEVLAGMIAEATGCSKHDALVAMAHQAPGRIGQRLRELAA